MTRWGLPHRAAAVVAVVALAWGAVACAPGEDSTAPPQPDPVGSSALEPTPREDTVACTYAPSGEPARPVDPPEPTAVASGPASVTLSFAVGDVTISMDRASAPCAIHSFESLAAQGFYTDTACHRLADNGLFMLQCGDPTGTGMGGPGYRFADEVDPQATYPAGTVAMANAGPDTNGSQFFLVYQDSQLPPAYTILGQMEEASIGVVNRIAAEGQDGANADGTGRPNNAATITAVRLG